MAPLPPLAELRAFAAAARHLSFKAAAAELGVTPTAISHQVRLLEQFLGRPLFRRRPRPLSLTPAGAELFPVVADGFAAMAAAVVRLRTVAGPGILRVTATNAFAARILVPRLARLRAAFPHLRLEIIGTDAVLDLARGEVDLAIRYARHPPPGQHHRELCRDRFHVVASPILLRHPRHASAPLAAYGLPPYPLIESEWLPDDAAAPTWVNWQAHAAAQAPGAPSLTPAIALSFREELHAIEAAIAGQGIAICSDVLVRDELADGRLVALSGIVLSGYGFYAAWHPGHPQEAVINAVAGWLAADLASPALPARPPRIPRRRSAP